MKSLNEIQKAFEKNGFDLAHESDMVQSRILSPIIEAMEEKGVTQSELSEKTGLKQPFISAVLNVRRKLNMEHIALFQKALGIVIQPPTALSTDQHQHKFYNKEAYEMPSDELYHINSLKQYPKNKDEEIVYKSRKVNVVSPSGKKKQPTSEYKTTSF